MKIGILTSSRADFGIYHSLLRELNEDNKLITEIIVFGSHTQEHHDNTVNEIKSAFRNKILLVEGMPLNDTQFDISNGYGKLILSFSNFWNRNKYDIVFALGDRFEMSAAIQASIPFEVNIAHIHGGETTIGSTDNIYRHQISLASKIHFTSNNDAVLRLNNILDNKNHIYNVGSLSLDNLKSLVLPEWGLILEKYKIPNNPYVLITFHPETVGLERNIKYLKILEATLLELSDHIHLIITLANADSLGSLYRELVFKIKNIKPKKISIVYSFGKLNYFSAIKNAKFLLGNSSSGIIEAASFQKYAINVGDRQKGRTRSKNIIDVPFKKENILFESLLLINGKTYKGKNNYHKSESPKTIIKLVYNFLSKDNGNK